MIRVTLLLAVSGSGSAGAASTAVDESIVKSVISATSSGGCCMPPLLDGAILILNSFVSLPPAFAALTVNSNLRATVGVPEIMPSVERVSPSGKRPLATVHVIVVMLVATRV